MRRRTLAANRTWWLNGGSSRHQSVDVSDSLGTERSACTYVYTIYISHCALIVSPSTAKLDDIGQKAGDRGTDQSLAGRTPHRTHFHIRCRKEQSASCALKPFREGIFRSFSVRHRNGSCVRNICAVYFERAYIVGGPGLVGFLWLRCRSRTRESECMIVNLNG